MPYSYLSAVPLVAKRVAFSQSKALYATLVPTPVLQKLMPVEPLGALVVAFCRRFC